MGLRRPVGTLELAVLEQVWARPSGVTPRQVLERLDGDLAYTTVMTILIACEPKVSSNASGTVAPTATDRW